MTAKPPPRADAHSALLETLRECQQTLAMLTDPERIRRSRVQEAWAQAVAAELRARTLLDKLEAKP